MRSHIHNELNHDAGATGGDGEGTAYVAPTVQPLGTLAELTRGGSLGPDDGFGGAGSSGSII